VKEAYATARALGTVNSQLDQLLTRAFAVAKKVRNETTIATSSVSIASVAVELAEKIFGSLAGKSVYLVGAGKMCELAARHLIAHGAKKIYVGNRTYDRAVALAAGVSTGTVSRALKNLPGLSEATRAHVVAVATSLPPRAPKEAKADKPAKSREDEEFDRLRRHLRECVTEVTNALATLSRPSPWSADIKASDEFLNPVFERFFKKLELPNLLRKTDYHILAGLVPKDKLDPEVTAKLDAILAAAEKARPTGE